MTSYDRTNDPEGLVRYAQMLEGRVDMLMAALQDVAAPWDTGPTTVTEGMKASCLEFQRRWNVANAALDLIK